MKKKVSVDTWKNKRRNWENEKNAWNQQKFMEQLANALVNFKEQQIKMYKLLEKMDKDSKEISTENAETIKNNLDELKDEIVHTQELTKILVANQLIDQI